MAVPPKTRAWIVLLSLPLLATVLLTGAATEPQPSRTAAQKVAAVKALLKERHEVLAKVVSILTTQLQAGTVDFPTLARAQEDALRAAADMAETPQERIAALREIVAVAKQKEQYFEDHLKLHFRVTKDEVLRAKAARLAAEIELLRAELKAG